jgi:quinol monooxygenase YgiN
VAHAQPPFSSPATGGVFAVAYVETSAASAAAGAAALEQYRQALRQEAGCLAIELFAQTDRRGHFAVIEAWRDEAAHEARDPKPKQQLLEALRPIRVSNYDERPYKPLTLGQATGAVEALQSGVFVIAHVDVAPNTPAPELLRRLAERSRNENGNARFDILQHSQRGNHFTVVEQWNSAAALEEHVAAAHTREYRDAIQPLTGSPLDERVYTAIATVP